MTEQLSKAGTFSEYRCHQEEALQLCIEKFSLLHLHLISKSIDGIDSCDSHTVVRECDNQIYLEHYWFDAEDNFYGIRFLAQNDLCRTPSVYFSSTDEDGNFAWVESEANSDTASYDLMEERFNSQVFLASVCASPILTGL